MFTSLTGDCSMTDHQMILIVHWICRTWVFVMLRIIFAVVVTSDQCEWHSFISDTGAD